MSVAKILFFLTRYSAFLDITVMMCCACIVSVCIRP